MASLWNKSLHVERESGLQRPEALQNHRRPQGQVNHKQLGKTSEDEAEKGGKRGNASRDGVAFRLEIGNLNGGGRGGDAVLQVEESGGKREEEIGGEGKERGGFGDEKREGEDKEEEEDGGGLERGESVDGGAALKERVSVRGD